MKIALKFPVDLYETAVNRTVANTHWMCRRSLSVWHAEMQPQVEEVVVANS